PDRHAHPDFSGPVHDGHQHDVHDDHATDDEGDPDQPREGDHQDLTDSLPEGHGIIGRLDLEIVPVTGPELVPHAHDRLDLHHRLGHAVLVMGADQDLVDDATWVDHPPEWRPGRRDG